MDDEPIGEAVDRLAAEHDRVTGKRPLERKEPDFEAEARAWLRDQGWGEGRICYSSDGTTYPTIDSLAAEYRRMYEAGRASRDADLRARAEQWELDAEVQSMARRYDVAACFADRARELRALLDEGDE